MAVMHEEAWSVFQALVAELAARPDLARRVALSTRLHSLTGQRLGSDAALWRQWAESERAVDDAAAVPAAVTTRPGPPLRLEPDYQRLAILGLVRAHGDLDRPLEASTLPTEQAILLTHARDDVRFFLPNRDRDYWYGLGVLAHVSGDAMQAAFTERGLEVRQRGGASLLLRTDFQLGLAGAMAAWAESLEGRALWFTPRKGGYDSWLLTTAQEDHVRGHHLLELAGFEEVRPAMVRTAERWRQRAHREMQSNELEQLLLGAGFPPKEISPVWDHHGRYARSYLALERRGWLWWLDPEDEGFEREGYYSQVVREALRLMAVPVERLEDRDDCLLVRSAGEDHQWVVRHPQSVNVHLILAPIEHFAEVAREPFCARALSGLADDRHQTVVGIFPRNLQSAIDRRRLLPRSDAPPSNVEKVTED